MNDRSAVVDRRDFLRKAGVRTVGVGATLTVSLIPSAHADSETEDEKRKARYRATDDVRTYYRVNRYPR